MNTKELQKILSDKVEEFGNFLREDYPSYEGKTLVPRKDLQWWTKNENEEAYLVLEDHLGFDIEMVESHRHNSEMEYIFKADGKFYRVWGTYDSWSGTEIDDPYDFTEVEEVEKVIKVWQNKK